MTLEDAIVYYSESAKECRRKARIESNDYMDMKDSAYEAEQLAGWLNELKVLRERINVQPEIIRCKDCRYYKTYQYVNGIRKFLPKCSFNNIYVAEEDFCSQAERRQDG